MGDLFFLFSLKASSLSSLKLKARSMNTTADSRHVNV
ncbi:mCG113646, isoform CRA_b [Mus musculus]|nr:mCG113646, isoform CRA_b [Mus musculus]